MEYFETLHLDREPFSNSPDPDLFYPTPSHLEALQRLEIAIRLRRGLNLVLGDVGTGKTTLSRVLLQSFERERERFRIHLLLDPGFQCEREMLTHLLRLFGQPPGDSGAIMELKDQLQHILLRQAVEEDRVVVLLIDEGQKLSDWALEILRELLNFESNSYKLLQVVVFAQAEFWDRLRGMRNLLDRVNLTVALRPLSLGETRAMLRHRLSRSGMPADGSLFTEGAVRRIHQFTGGHPRQIVTLCHQAVLRAIILQKSEVTGRIIREIHRQRQEVPPAARVKANRPILGWVACGFLLLSAGLALYGPLGLPGLWDPEGQGMVAPPQSPVGSVFPPARGPGGGGSDRPSGGAAAEEALPAAGPGEEAESPHGAPAVEQAAAVREWWPETWFEWHPLGEERLDSGRRIVVRKGETLSSIVERHYGIPLGAPLLRRLQQANAGLRDPHRLTPGETVFLPPLGEAERGFQSEILASFADEGTALSWAHGLATAGRTVFVVRLPGGDRLTHGVAAGIHGAPEGGSGAWVRAEDVVRVFQGFHSP
jgi:general secretion pathway protein A